MCKGFSKLLLSEGGGVINRNHQAEQANSVTVAIGLGGAGIDCLRALKKKVYNCIQSDNVNEEPPVYSHIRFLAVDTDTNVLAKNDGINAIDRTTEFFDISCSNITGLIQSAEIKADPMLKWLRTDPRQSWLLTQVSAKEADDVQIRSTNKSKIIQFVVSETHKTDTRQDSRLSFFQKCGDFAERLRALIEEAKEGRDGADINVLVFSSLCGATGSGILLDVCYILQYVLSSMGVEKQASVSGFFFLPDVYVSGNNADYLKTNGFASMKELDYAMNYAVNGDRWEQIYDGFRISTQNPPVDLVHLIAAKTNSGQTIPEGYDYAMHLVADFAMQFISKNQGLTLKSYIKDVSSMVSDTAKTTGAVCNYCLLGGSGTYIPYKEIITYVASGIFDGFGKEYRLSPDFRRFIRENELRYSDLFRKLHVELPQMSFSEIQYKKVYQDAKEKGSGTAPDVLLPLYEEVQKLDEQLRKRWQPLLNTELFMEDGTAVESPEDVSLTVRIRKRLLEIAQNPDKGPSYAASMLDSQNKQGLFYYVKGFIRDNETESGYENYIFDGKQKEIENAFSRLMASEPSDREERAEDYVDAWRKYLEEEAVHKQYIHMSYFTNELLRQLEDLYKYFQIFSEIMENIQCSFKKNQEFLSAPEKTPVSGEEPLLTVQKNRKLKEELDQKVEDLKKKEAIQRFIGEMYSQSEVWQSKDQDRISAAVNHCFTDILDSDVIGSFSEYVCMKYQTEEDRELKRRVYDEILEPLGERSVPIFRIHDADALASAGIISYLLIPDEAPIIEAAARSFISDQGGQEPIHMYSVPSSDRISFFQILCGVPLFAYQGVYDDLDVYRKNSEKATGLHIYEGARRDARDNRMLPDLIPLSRIAPSDYTEAMRNAIRDYEKAVQFGIISYIEKDHSVREYYLNCIDEEEISRKKQELHEGAEMEKETNPPNISLPEKEPLRNIPVRPYRMIPCAGGAGYEETIVRDCVIGSVEYMKMIREQIRIADSYAEMSGWNISNSEEE